jgi:glycosyltransferase involved in cell wall biosynthesis
MKIAILSPGFDPRNERLQPQRTLLEMGRQLESLGNTVTLISDGLDRLPEHDQVFGLPVHRLQSSQNFYKRENQALFELISALSPDLLLWHLSLSSLLHQDLRLPFEQAAAGILTSPIHNPRQIIELGPSKLWSNLDLISIQLAGMLLPGAVLRKAVARSSLMGLITLSKATRSYLVNNGLPPEKVKVVSPGVSSYWLEHRLDDTQRNSIREAYGFRPDDFVLTYFGSPAPVRGLFTLLKAVEIALQSHPNLRLMILSRRTYEQWGRETARLHSLLNHPPLMGRVQLEDGFLSEKDLIDRILASEAVCLPFELIPSDVPLSVLESMALGKAVVTTDIGCLPELISEEHGFITRKGSPGSLARCLDELMSSNGQVTRRGNSAREYVKANYTWEHMGHHLQKAIFEFQSQQPEELNQR